MSSLPAAATGNAASADAAELDRALVAASRAGDREAFGQLVERHQQATYRLCYRFVGNHHDASDLTQDVFLRAYRGLHRFRGDSSFATWLYRIAVNVSLSHRSARKSNHEELSEAQLVVASDLVERMQRQETTRIVRDAIGRLPAKQKATLILKLYHDRTHEEIAGILGTTVGTAKANLFHALANLRKTLTETGGTP